MKARKTEYIGLRIATFSLKVLYKKETQEGSEPIAISRGRKTKRVIMVKGLNASSVTFMQQGRKANYKTTGTSISEGRGGRGGSHFSEVCCMIYCPPTFIRTFPKWLKNNFITVVQ